MCQLKKKKSQTKQTMVEPLNDKQNQKAGQPKLKKNPENYSLYNYKHERSVLIAFLIPSMLIIIASR